MIVCVASSAWAQTDAALPRYKAVIPSILYKSGSPTEEGLQWLCQSGFRRAYSIYGARTTQYGPRNEAMLVRGYDERRCVGPDGIQRTLEWRSAATRGRIPMLLEAIHQAIQAPDGGPILVHCWGGRHYSVLVATLALKQFCGYSNEQAVAYLNEVSDNAHRFPQLQQAVESFRGYARLRITPQQRKKFCTATPPDRWAQPLELRPPVKPERSRCTWFAGSLAWRRFLAP